MRYGPVLACFLLPAAAHAEQGTVDCGAPGTACAGVKARASFRVDFYVGPQPRTYRAVAPEPLPPPAPRPPPPKDHGFAGLTGSLLLLPGAQWSPGVGGSFRIRGAPALALDLGLHRVGFRDVEKRPQQDTVLSLSAFLYPFSRGWLQPYAVLGLTHDWAHVGATTLGEGGNWRHLGGAAGAGLEAFMTPRFSFFTDVRGLIRTRSGGDPGPEFRQDGRSSDTSVGAVVLVGLAFYAFGS